MTTDLTLAPRSTPFSLTARDDGNVMLLTREAATMMTPVRWTVTRRDPSGVWHTPAVLAIPGPQGQAIGSVAAARDGTMVLDFETSTAQSKNYAVMFR